MWWVICLQFLFALIFSYNPPTSDFPQCIKLIVLTSLSQINNLSVVVLDPRRAWMLINIFEILSFRSSIAIHQQCLDFFSYLLMNQHCECCSLLLINNNFQLVLKSHCLWYGEDELLWKQPSLSQTIEQVSLEPLCFTHIYTLTQGSI